MSELVKKLVEDHEKSLKSVRVDRQIPAVIDMHLMALYDDNVIDPDEERGVRIRDAAQMFINDIWTNSEHVNVDGDVCAKLPVVQRNIMLPREKPLPKEKSKTKWEMFAETKGIVKRKKSRMEFDEELKEWVPRYGYGSKRSRTSKEWAIEVPDRIDPNTDLFEKRNNARKDRIAKNEFQRLRNIARNAKSGATDPNTLSVNPTGGGSKDELTKAFHIAKKSTASLGKFDTKVRGEDKQVEKGRKRQFAPNNQSGTTERDKMLKMAKEIGKGDSVLNAKKAAGRLMAGEQGQAGFGKKKQKENYRATKPKIGMRNKAKQAQRAGKRGKK